MLEQTKKNGRVYNVQLGSKSVLSRPATVPEYGFGPYRPITVYRIDDHEMWVKDEAHGDWYHYKGDDYPLTLVSKTDEHEEPADGCFYLYGMAVQDDFEIPYFLQDTPNVQVTVTPKIEKMEMPFSMRALDYGRIFTYPSALKELLGDCPVAYADRFKRPIIRSRGRTYPISLEKKSSKWAELSDSCYPIVADLSGTHFAVLDLEPDRTEEENTVYESIMGYYEEDTIRGGRHKLIRLDDPTFKFRYGKGLELIANGMITFYGINGVMLSSDPDPMKTTGFAPVGHTARIAQQTEVPDEVKEMTAKLIGYAGDADLIKLKIREKHRSNTDNSNREYRILSDLYTALVAPHRYKFPEKAIPWILAACADGVIEPREKHETQRNGLPYLVYLSAIICEKKEGAKVWKPA